jgi:hypothetical protein
VQALGAQGIARLVFLFLNRARPVSDLDLAAAPMVLIPVLRE